MLHIDQIRPVEPATAPVTELTLSDRLIVPAKDAERAGFREAVERLVRLACNVFDEAGLRRA